MKPENEGYIKFNCLQTLKDFEFSDEDFKILEKWRSELYKIKLIGAYPDGIGFGNISIRYNAAKNFIISGSATGNLKSLEKKHYALVTGYDFNMNSLASTGRIKASSESLSHAIIYETSSACRAVIHVHSRLMWDQLKYTLPTTNETVPYGTPEMAEEIKKIIKQHDLIEKGIIVMGGHEEGIISFGPALEIAGNMILKYWRELKV